MKQLLFSKALLSAATLMVGTLVFTACSNDEFDGNTNPTYDGESVKTQFAINIPVAGKSTRLGQDIVQGQETPTFRGMDNIRLVPFTSTNSLEGTTALQYNPIVLGAIDGLNGEVDADNGTGKYKVYSDVDIPVGTQSFLFYGEAKTGSDASEKTNGAIVPSFEQGWTMGNTLSTLLFSLKPISNGNGDAQTKLSEILKHVADATGTSTKWSAATTEDLQGYYNEFISMKAGSANNIKLALQMLYNTMKSGNVADEDGLKEAICTAIDDYFIVSGDAAPDYKLEYDLAKVTEDVSIYPNSYNLPDGAVQISWSGSDFVYVTSVDYDGDPTNTMNVASLDKYVYPASLYYWVKTPILTNTAPLTSNGSYITGTKWNDILLQYQEGNVVTTSTQSVALVNSIDYAVASLNLSAKFADMEIKDNGATWPTGNPVGEKIVTIGDESFPLTGILIGGQNSVGWDFHKTGNEEVTIYDGSMDEVFVKKGTDLSTPMVYSLALETAGNDGGGEQVRFAIEMTNNSSEAFTGADGIVPVGGKFYLVGTLTSNDTNTKVFEQDHKTVAKVTINSLKSAYNCIPDLRSPKLELGLSVDLTWEEGLVDEVTIE